MLVASLVKGTLELQGFRVVSVTGDPGGLVVTIGADRRYAPRCGRCREAAAAVWSSSRPSNRARRRATARQPRGSTVHDTSSSRTKPQKWSRRMLAKGQQASPLPDTSQSALSQALSSPQPHASWTGKRPNRTLQPHDHSFRSPPSKSDGDPRATQFPIAVPSPVLHPSPRFRALALLRREPPPTHPSRCARRPRNLRKLGIRQTQKLSQPPMPRTGQNC